VSDVKLEVLAPGAQAIAFADLQEVGAVMGVEPYLRTGKSFIDQ
jgi:hypothetical protein